MKFRQTAQTPSSASTEPQSVATKWRQIGAPGASDEPYVVTKIDGSTVLKTNDDYSPVKTSAPPAKTIFGIDRTIPNPLEDKGKEERNYRGRKSTRSRTKSRSRSPRRRVRKSRSKSRSRGRRLSRSRSKSRGRRSSR